MFQVYALDQKFHLESRHYYIPIFFMKMSKNIKIKNIFDQYHEILISFQSLYNLVNDSLNTYNQKPYLY